MWYEETVSAAVIIMQNAMTIYTKHSDNFELMKFMRIFFLIFVSGCFYFNIFTQENNFAVISLGIRCLPAMQIEAYGLKSGTYPFDWNSTEFDGLMLILQNDFNDFLQRENIKYETTQILSTNGGLVIHGLSS